ncbi:quinolinate synthetase [Alkalispirochaeta americana]|uniref:quinolinate synthase n=1 Tax=Alkalispirochaeta americana TaxID=159291 RepID=A0A1N6T4H3_9SPIO|nr:quinolinate synthase NadA [Alkalispirochaeta americana]SIQ48295.1 quinolinate synthetase [Alkalispirochaeta americana]
MERIENEGASLFDILDVKERLGSRLLIPAHFYVASDVVDLADCVGDSYKLAVDVSRNDAEFIVFCGVRFMAEGARVLARDHQRVLMPERAAGCPMADMIDAATARDVLTLLQRASSRPVVPVVYMNSDTATKSLCGQEGGAVCTSSNATAILQYYFDQGKNVFFFPDYHLGSNVARALGIPPEQTLRVSRETRSHDFSNRDEPRLFLWDGHCPVHVGFTPRDVERLRGEHPDAQVMVHPECEASVVDMADSWGSTREIRDAVAGSPPGTSWIIGTELNFVKTLARDNPDKKVLPLKASLCRNMAKVTVANTARAVRSVEDFLQGRGDLFQEVQVDPFLARDARQALHKMISIVEQG